ncbi:M4 family metallopeptidase [Nocardioides sp.]|uniref:M4 family metallopeptidase n=1 Tax=Nocardioides sp. TaxID=35761 RepID=UPI00271628CD|nr:M4 family metallopeptidase [Nocardioides sp.]MDO9456076.1 M4 family metallopeptidase [Nocardioides sp.]
MAVAALATALAGSLALGTPSSTAAPAAADRASASADRSGPEGRAAQGDRRDRAVDAAAAYVRNHGPAGRGQGGATKLAGTHAGTKGTYYVAYQKTLQGLPIYGADFVVAVDESGRATGATGKPARAISLRSTTPTRTRAQARATARRQVDRVRTVSKPVLTVYAVGTPTLAWRTKVTGTKAGTPSITTVWSDARTGKVLLASDAVREGTGNGYYYPGVTIGTSGSGSSYSMTDPARSGVKCGGQNGAAYTGTDNVWGNGSGTNLETACVDVLYSVGKEVDMLSAWLGRSGIKGNGTNYPAKVGLADVNAYYDGSTTNFGHSQDNARQLTAIDIVAHENGHGIFQTTPGGSTGGNETGGMNESTGDIFGALTEFYANNPDDPGDYLVGEEANLVGQGPIRNMANPSAVGDPNCYSSSIPNTEVHAAAGPLNHWFYLLANGTSGSTSCNGSTLTGIGLQNAGKVFYNGLLLKTSSWTHAKARVATLTAAKNLFGTTDCTTFNRVRDAWAGISVPAQSGEPTCGGGTTPPPTGGTCTEFTATGTLSSKTSTYKPSTSGFTTTGGVINACLTGPSSADFDLYVQKLSGSTWSDVAKSESASSTETIAYTAGSGTYRVEVYAYSGSGSYTVKYDTP